MSTSDKIKSNDDDDDVCEVNDMLQNMTTADEVEVSVCANCGKEGANQRSINTR